MTSEITSWKSRLAATVAGAALIAMSGAAFAADIDYGEGSLKDVPEATPEYTISVNGGLTTDYVFRGVSQSDEGAAAFVGADFSYRMFYVGVWASSVDETVSDGNVEIDIYAGIKKSWSGIDLDVGVLYYTYPNNDFANELNYIELKASAGTKIWRDIAVTGTVYYSPDFYFEAGATWTAEGKVSAPLPVWDLTLSATYGYVTSDDDDGNFSGALGDDEYSYWNVGLSKSFLEHFTVDVRYWDTDVDDAIDIADERVVGTVSFSY